MAFAFSDLLTYLRFLVAATSRFQKFITVTIHLTSQLSANAALRPNTRERNPFVKFTGDAILSKEPCEVLERSSWAAYPTQQKHSQPAVAVSLSPKENISLSHVKYGLGGEPLATLSAATDTGSGLPL